MKSFRDIAVVLISTGKVELCRTIIVVTEKHLKSPCCYGKTAAVGKVSIFRGSGKKLPSIKEFSLPLLI
jgi:hypothetical protein